MALWLSGGMDYFYSGRGWHDVLLQKEEVVLIAYTGDQGDTFKKKPPFGGLFLVQFAILVRLTGGMTTGQSLLFLLQFGIHA